MKIKKTRKKITTKNGCNEETRASLLADNAGYFSFDKLLASHYRIEALTVQDSNLPVLNICRKSAFLANWRILEEDPPKIFRLPMWQQRIKEFMSDIKKFNCGVNAALGKNRDIWSSLLKQA